MRSFPLLVFEKFGQAKPLPKNSTKTIKFRRYFLKDSAFSASDNGIFSAGSYFNTDNFDPTKKILTEGQTPAATGLDKQDLYVTLTQFGDRTEISDVVADTHEDLILQEAIEILGEQAPVLIEKARFNALKAGTNVVRSGSVSLRTSVAAVFTTNVQRIATRTLKRQLAKQITSTVKSTPSYGTEPIAPSFIAVSHVDLEYDISKAQGFVPVEKYGNGMAFDGEIGKIGDCRYILTTIAEPWADSGAAVASNTQAISTTGVLIDTYPILYLAKDAFGMVPLKGKAAIVPMVVNPKPSDSDPLAQRGHVSWKTMQATIILNEAWIMRAEVACTDNAYMTD